jgi:hypothetical protein
MKKSGEPQKRRVRGFPNVLPCMRRFIASRDTRDLVPTVGFR